MFAMLQLLPRRFFLLLNLYRRRDRNLSLHPQNRIDRDVKDGNEALLSTHWKRISLKSWADQLLDDIEDGGNIMKENAIAIDREEVISDIPGSSWAVYHGFDRGA
jgi:hypothetical protein